MCPKYIVRCNLQTSQQSYKQEMTSQAMRRKWENFPLCDSLMQSHEMETKAAVRGANVTIICNYIVKINNRLLRPT
jgi:hypothetical protein